MIIKTILLAACAAILVGCSCGEADPKAGETWVFMGGNDDPWNETTAKVLGVKNDWVKYELIKNGKLEKVKTKKLYNFLIAYDNTNPTSKAEGKVEGYK